MTSVTTNNSIGTELDSMLNKMPTSFLTLPAEYDYCILNAPVDFILLHLNQHVCASFYLIIYVYYRQVKWIIK